MEAQKIQGLIIRSQGGFYQVLAGDGSQYPCRGRGRFRKEETQLLVGDRVLVQPSPDGSGFITDLLPRKNSLIRPPVANLDRLALVVSARDPAPNLLVLDELTAIAVRRGIPAALIFTKNDLSEMEGLAELYRRAGFAACVVESFTGRGLSEARELLSGGIAAVCGNSGAGKSTLLNALFPGLGLATGEVSRKLGRGRHTTRHVELYPNGEGGFIADTPGFSAVDFLQFERMPPEELESCFPEFSPYLGKCRFTGCSHRVEKGCAVLAAVEAGEIAASRHQSYCAIYGELDSVPQWQR